MASAIVDIILSLLRSGKEYLRDMSKIPLEKIEQTLDITTLVWMLLYGSFPYPTAQQQIEEQLGNIEKTIEENPEEARQGFTWLYRIGRLYRLVHVQPLWVNDLLDTAIRYKRVKTINDFGIFSDSYNYHIMTIIPPISVSDLLRAYDSVSYSTEKYEMIDTQTILHKILRLSEKLITYDLTIARTIPVIKRINVEQISLMDVIEKYTSLLTENVFTESMGITDGFNVLSKGKTILSLSDYLSLTDEVVSLATSVVRRLSEYLALSDEIGSETYSFIQALTLTFSELIGVSDGQTQGYPYPEQPEKTYMQYVLSEVTRLTDLLEVITTMVAPVLSLVSTTEYAYATAYNFQRKLVRTSDGTLYCVYIKQLNGYYQIYVKKSVDNGETWTDETRISTYPGMENYYQICPSIAVDSQDRLHVVWYGKATGYTTYFQIWYNYFDGSWHTPVRISTYLGMEDHDQHYVSIAVDSQDRIHVVWAGRTVNYPSYDQIWYNYFDGSWHTPVRISTYAGMENRSQIYPSIAVDSLDRLHVVWQYYMSYWQIWYNYYDGVWHSPVRISTYTGMENYHQQYVSIAVDSQDRIHVVWTGKATAGGDQIWYAYYDGVWHTPIRISTYLGMENYGQTYPSIAVDSQDRIHVVWTGRATGYTDYDKVWYAKYDGEWSTPECLQPTGQNTYPNLRWSRYPVSNRVTNRLDYVFTEGIESPYDIMFASLFIG